MHHHKGAANVLFHGAKQWFLATPAYSYAKQQIRAPTRPVERSPNAPDH